MKLIRKRLAVAATGALIAASPVQAADDKRSVADPETRLAQAADRYLNDMPSYKFGNNPFSRIYVLYRTTDRQALKLYRRMQKYPDLAKYYWIAFGEKGRAKRGAAWMAYNPTQASIERLLTNRAKAPAITKHKELQKAYVPIKTDLHGSLEKVTETVTGERFLSPMILYRDAEGATYVYWGVPNVPTLKQMARRADW